MLLLRLRLFRRPGGVQHQVWRSERRSTDLIRFAIMAAVQESLASLTEK